MTNAPRIATFPLEQLSTRQIEDLPPVPPHSDPFLAICLLQTLLDALLIRQHRGQPVFTRLPIMHAVNPPLPLDPELILEEQQQIRARHRAASEEMLRHPSAIEVVRCRLVREDVHEQFPAGLQRTADFCGE